MKRPSFHIQGFTLTELLVALGISAVVGLVATRQITSAQRFSDHTNEQFELEKAKVTIARELKKLFNRSRFLAQAAVGPVLAVTFGADLRPCVPGGGIAGAAQFNPLNSNASNPVPAATASSYTLVTLLCCPGVGTATVNAPNPIAGGTYVVPNRCPRNAGLTINYRRGNDNHGSCYGNFGQGGGTFTGMSLVVGGFDYSRTPLVPSFLNPGINQIPTYTPGGPNALFSLRLVSSDNYSSGERSGINPLTLLAGDNVQAGADILRVAEFYGALGNLTTSKLIDCSSGVDR